MYFIAILFIIGFGSCYFKGNSTHFVDINRREIEDLPFDLEVELFEDKLGFEVAIETDLKLHIGGIKDFYIGAYFDPCDTVFHYYIDFRDWSDTYFIFNDDPTQKRFDYNMTIKIPRFCLSDLPLPQEIPFISLCAYIDNVMSFKKGIVGDLKIDFAVLLSAFQWKKEGVRLFTFSFGETPECYDIKDANTCIKKNCGWCDATNQCLEKRKDLYSSDLCSFCPRCSFFTEKDRKKECLSKDSCGWCEGIGCMTGDSLGTFEASDLCLPDPKTQHTSAKWEFIDTSKRDNLWGTMGVLGIGFGIIIGIFITLGVIAAIFGYLYYKKKKNETPGDSFIKLKEEAL